MEKENMFQENKVEGFNEAIIDHSTSYGRGYESKFDPTTDWDKGIRFYTCDGKEVATMEEVMQYNKMYFDKMMIDNQNVVEDNMHR